VHGIGYPIGMMREPNDIFIIGGEFFELVGGAWAIATISRGVFFD